MALMDTIVFIPTYNERDNIGPLIDEIKAIGGDPGILVVDDDSPDGTWKVVEERASRYAGVHLLRRRGERGRGGAGIAGFNRAIELGASRIVEMDGDGQHDPAAIPLMLKAIESNDVVLGSRFMPGGADSERSLTRRVVSAFARRYINSVLRLKLSDPTTGYRCFRKTALEAIGLENLRSKDQFIVTEILYSCSRAGLKIREVPIAFRRRKSGSSKLGAAALTKYLIRVILLRVRG